MPAILDNSTTNTNNAGKQTNIYQFINSSKHELIIFPKKSKGHAIKTKIKPDNKNTPIIMFI